MVVLATGARQLGSCFCASSHSLSEQGQKQQNTFSSRSQGKSLCKFCFSIALSSVHLSCWARKNFFFAFLLNISISPGDWNSRASVYEWFRASDFPRNSNLFSLRRKACLSGCFQRLSGNSNEVETVAKHIQEKLISFNIFPLARFDSVTHQRRKSSKE